MMSRRVPRVLRDFLAIVLGVLAALFIDDYRNNWSAVDREVTYLTRMADELRRGDASTIRGWEIRYRLLEEALLEIRTALDNGDTSLPDSSQFVAWIRRSEGRFLRGQFAEGGFQELRTRGETDLVQNPGVREGLIRYHASRDLLLRESRAADSARKLMNRFVSYDDLRALSDSRRAVIEAMKEEQAPMGREWMESIPPPPPLSEAEILSAMKRSPEFSREINGWLNDALRLANAWGILGTENTSLWQQMNSYLSELTLNQ